MQKKIKIDFDTNNRETILHILDQHLQNGYALKSASSFSGIMIFESTYEEVRYAVRQKCAYRNSLPEAEGWTNVGGIGPYCVFSTTDNTIDDYPAEELSEKDLHKKTTLLNLLQLPLYILLGFFTFKSFMSEFSGSTASLFEMQLSDILQPICLILGVISILGKLFTSSNPGKTMQNPSWFKLYVMPWIMLSLIIGIICALSYFVIQSDKSHPATEVPFQAPRETAKIRYTFFGKILSADGEFLYIAHDAETARKLYDEAQTDNHDGRWFSRYFWNFNVYTKLDTTCYENIDNAVLMDENANGYDLNTYGILVLIDNRLYGIAFEKESTTAEFILNQLNLKMNK